MNKLDLTYRILVLILLLVIAIFSILIFVCWLKLGIRF